MITKFPKIFTVFCFSALVSFPLYAVDYVFPGNAFAPIVLNDGDTLTVLSGHTFVQNIGAVATVTAHGGSHIILQNNATISGNMLASQPAISITQTVPNKTVRILNNGRLTTQMGGGYALSTDSGGPGIYSAVDLTNASTGIIDGIALLHSTTQPHVINNQNGGLIQGNVAGGAVIQLGSPLSPNATSVTINNSGLISNNVMSVSAITTDLGAQGPAVITINNHENGTIDDDVQNFGNDNIQYIFTAGNHSVLSGCFQGSGSGSSENQYNINVGVSGSETLECDLIDIDFINVHSGALFTAGNEITGFRTFTTANNTYTRVDGLFESSANGILTNRGHFELASDLSILGAGGFTNIGLAHPNGNRIITGDYTQTATGTLAFTISNSLLYDTLQVTGLSSLHPNSNFRMIVLNYGNDLNTGDVFDVYLAANLPTLPRIDSLPSFLFTPSLFGNTIRLTLTKYLNLNWVINNSSTRNIHDLAVATHSLLHDRALANQTLVNELLRPLSNLANPAEIEAALNQLAFNQNSVVLTTTQTMMNTSVNFLNRLFNYFVNVSAVKNASSQTFKPLGFIAGNQLHSGCNYMAGDEVYPGMNVGTIVFGGTEKQSTRSSGAYPFRSTLGGLGVMAEISASDYLNFGLGGAYTRGHSKIHNVDANVFQPLSVASYQMSFLSAYTCPYSLVDFGLIFSFARNRISQTNRILFGSVGGTVNLNVDSQYYLNQNQIQLNAAKAFNVCHPNFYWIPMMSLSLNHTDRKPYSDRSSPAAQFHSRLKYDLPIYSVGFSLANIQQNNSDKKITQIEAHINYFAALRNKIPRELAQFRGGGSPFILAGLKPYRNTVNLGGSVSYPFESGFSIMGLYDLNFRKHYYNQALTLKLAWEF